MPVRLHALDAIRAFALLIGIVLHATISFLPGFAASGLPFVDNSPSVVLGLVFFCIHQFRMLLFFLIAGFFGHLAFHRRGLRSFVVDRLCRITVPLIVGWIVVFPAIIVAVIIAAIQISQSGVLISPPPPNADPFAFPLTHLWFLYVLQWLYVLVLVVRFCFDRVIDRTGALRCIIDCGFARLMQRPWGVVVVATPLCVALFLQVSPKWFGIKTPDDSLIPDLTPTIAFTSAFCLGWILHRQPDLMRVWERHWRLYLGLGFIFTTGAVGIAGPIPTYLRDERSWMTLSFAACYSLAAWCWTFGLIGVGLRFFSTPNAWIRYLADSSYWLYLVHLPLIFLAQAIVMHWPLHWSIKLPLILLVTVPPMLLSYHYLVRSTFIGGFLNGRRYPFHRAEAHRESTEDSPLRAQMQDYS